MSQEGQIRSLDTYPHAKNYETVMVTSMFYFPRKCKNDTPVTVYHKFLRLVTLQEEKCHLTNFAPTCPNSPHNACIKIFSQAIILPLTRNH